MLDAYLHRDDRKIRREERDMAAQDRRQLAQSEKHVPNRRENAGRPHDRPATAATPIRHR
ncbi:hypothetical protein Q3A80_04810 [Burkholderia sp. SR8]|uniref:hypothetical protein n=1 Tax=Burkholderia sp. SR8 TaxID=3062277 RepID=UPI0040634001